MKKIFNLLVILFFVTLLSPLISLASGKISAMTVDGANSVSTEQAKKLFDDGTLFVDVRSTKAWNAGRISDAVLLDIKSNFSEQSLLAEAKKECHGYHQKCSGKITGRTYIPCDTKR